MSGYFALGEIWGMSRVDGNDVFVNARRINVYFDFLNWGNLAI